MTPRLFLAFKGEPQPPGAFSCLTSNFKLRMQTLLQNEPSTIFYNLYKKLYRNGLTPKIFDFRRFSIFGRYNEPKRKRLQSL